MFGGAWRPLLVAATMVAAPTVALAQASPRDLLVQAAFEDRSKPEALARVNRARALAEAESRRDPDDQEAVVVGATALGYRAKLTGSRQEAMAAKRAFVDTVARFPRNAEAQLALGAWHLGIIAKFGRIVGRAAVGAQKATGVEALDRAVALGGNRAMFYGLAGLLRLQLDPGDARGRQLMELAAKAPTPTAIDRYMHRAALLTLTPLRAGNEDAARAAADRLLPFGWYKD